MNKVKFWMMDNLFRNEITEINEEYNRKLETIVKKIKYDSEQKTKRLSIVDSILKEKDRSIIGCSKNKLGDDVYIVQSIRKNDVWFMLYSNEYKAINNHPRIMATYNKESRTEYDCHPAYIKIDDILVEDNNVGNGSILMPYFIDYCKNTDAEYITGWLSSVDMDHFDRSEHFYKKHGFEVQFNEERTSGSIKYILK